MWILFANVVFLMYEVRFISSFHLDAATRIPICSSFFLAAWLFYCEYAAMYCVEVCNLEFYFLLLALLARGANKLHQQGKAWFPSPAQWQQRWREAQAVEPVVVREFWAWPTCNFTKSSKSVDFWQETFWDLLVWWLLISLACVFGGPSRL